MPEGGPIALLDKLYSVIFTMSTQFRRHKNDFSLLLYNVMFT